MDTNSAQPWNRSYQALERHESFEHVDRRTPSTTLQCIERLPEPKDSHYIEGDSKKELANFYALSVQLRNLAFEVLNMVPEKFFMALQSFE